MGALICDRRALSPLNIILFSASVVIAHLEHLPLVNFRKQELLFVVLQTLP